jgi:uncharacterized protein with GYD domain
MNKYVGLIKLTDEGHEKLAKAGEVLDKTTEIVEGVGGKILNIWAVMGAYDFVAFIEYPTEVAAFEALSKTAALGYFTTETLPAVEMDKFLTFV